MKKGAKNILLAIFLFSSFQYRSQDTITYSKMSHEQFKAWDSIERKWRTEQFMPYLKKENIKMSCASCTSVYVWLVFKCDSSGTTYSFMKNRKCGSEFSPRQLNDIKKGLNSIKLPGVYLNTYLKVMMGNGLKC